MRRVDGVVGNRHDDPTLAERIDVHERAGTLERVVIESEERKKSRLRVETDAGTDLGIVVGDDELRSGDVLFVEDDRAAVVAFETRAAFVVELPGPSDATTAAAVEFGHRVGNQHWDIAIEDGAVYIPVEAEKRILEDVLGPYLPEGATTRYEEVDAELFVDDDDGDEPDHPHADESGHSHSHSDGYEHTHSQDHGDGHEHNHSDGGRDHTHE